jgi:hypothetical protein
MRCDFIPPHLTNRLARSRQSFIRSRSSDSSFRTTRQVLTAGHQRPVISARGTFTVFDANSRFLLPGDPAPGDLEQAGRIRQWAEAAQVLGAGDIPDGVVRYGQGYANAFFDGRYLVFGQGDGEVFGDFTGALDVFAHELGHDMVQDGPALIYAGQPGALNEHVADVLGICVMQYQQQACTDWRLGQEIFLDGVSSLRDMLNPGTAYDTPLLGHDPQPTHMSDYVETTEDNGGVHINSGIPNRAFALFVTQVGLPSWDVPLRIWREALTGAEKDTGFSGFAALTLSRAGGHHDVLRDSWGQVGVIP